MWVSQTLFSVLVSGSEFQANLALNPSRQWRYGPLGDERSGYGGQARIFLLATISALMKYSGPNKSGGLLSPKREVCVSCVVRPGTQDWSGSRGGVKPSLGRRHSRGPGCSLPQCEALLSRLPSSLSSRQQSTTILILNSKVSHGS